MLLRQLAQYVNTQMHLGVNSLSSSTMTKQILGKCNAQRNSLCDQARKSRLVQHKKAYVVLAQF